MAGRRKLDSRLKEARGNPGKRSYAATPQPKPATPEPPDCIARIPGAVEIWNRHVPEMLRIGTLNLLGKEMFALGCRCMANAIRELDLSDRLVEGAKGKAMLSTGPKGGVHVMDELQLALSMESAALKNIQRAQMIFQEFGNTTKSLAGVFGSGSAAPEDPSEKAAQEFGLA